MKIAEFREYLKINKQHLDDEVIQQPSLFYEVSEAFALAAAERDALKDRIATIDAELDAEIRTTLGDAKVTEAMVKNKVQANSKHETAFEEWLKAKENADLLGALKEAFQQRSYMLRDLCTLHATGYFEQSAIRSDASMDATVYKHRRQRLAAGREAKK